MSRHNRQRQTVRRRQHLEPLPLILVVTEGETEENYLVPLRRSCRNPRVAIKYSQCSGNPHETVKHAVKLAEQSANDPYDQIWCVFDADVTSGLKNAIELARSRNELQLAISNPCFEVWLLLHFETSPGSLDGSRVTEKLRKYDPGYKKPQIAWSRYSDKVRGAETNARSIDLNHKDANDPFSYASSGMYRLTELIRGFAN